MCLRRAPEKYITGAALDKAAIARLDNVEKRKFLTLPALKLRPSVVQPRS
jgi:hypothetical protein